MEGLGQRLQRLRVERGLTQQQLAAPQYTRGFLATIEAGTRVPSVEALDYFAQRLGAQGDDLRHGRPAGAAEELTAELERGRRLLSRGQIKAAVELFAATERVANGYQLPVVECYARYCAAESELHQGKLPEALRAYEHAELLAAGAPIALRATLVRRRAQCLLNLESVAAAITLLEEGLAEVRAGTPVDPDAELRLLAGLITPYHELGALGRMLDIVDEGLAVAPRATRQEWVATFYDLAGQRVLESKGFAEVDRWWESARQTFAALGLDSDAGSVHWSRGYALSQAERLSEARTELGEALATFDAVGRVQDAAGVALELADVCRRLGETAEATELANRAAKVCARHDLLAWLAEADRILGLLAGEAGDLPSAGRLLERSIDRYSRAGSVYDTGKTCRLYGDLLLRNGKTDEALRVLRLGAQNIASQTRA
ncbi:helix-turn-helix domain-containing protein [Amycolatopsis sp. H20-H5]|uniref:helix-turn-helix domain-containing protein n=1 Tax=Amycolatopsis sp. H20-H5 TaxID=3046309 RepID=UPI002DBDD36B|nr:helix-turn-helix transcriptional regulator [Amycolatopsis sp. H20-H5]MEC3976428.1 helix-turn-helix transcriptional regulator [Amycolatopsis sp. H20-H5]